MGPWGWPQENSLTRGKSKFMQVMGQDLCGPSGPTQAHAASPASTPAPPPLLSLHLSGSDLLSDSPVLHAGFFLKSCVFGAPLPGTLLLPEPPMAGYFPSLRFQVRCYPSPPQRDSQLKTVLSLSPPPSRVLYPITLVCSQSHHLHVDSVFANPPTCWNLSITPKSTLRAFSLIGGPAQGGQRFQLPDVPIPHGIGARPCSAFLFLLPYCKQVSFSGEEWAQTVQN